jgi:Lipocalin-like domain
MKRPQLDSDQDRLATIQMAILATLEMAGCMRSLLRKIVRSPEPVLLTDEEKVKLLESMSAYAGTYTADGEKVVHHVDTSWNGSWTGTDQVRFYKLDGDTLTITTAPLTVFSGEEVKMVLVWKKVH